MLENKALFVVSASIFVSSVRKLQPHSALIKVAGGSTAI